jgi:hypothetical protein
LILRRSHLNSAQDEAKAGTSRTLTFVDDQARVRSSKLSPDLYDGITESGLPARSSRFSPLSASGTGLRTSLVHLEAAAAEILGIKFLDRLKAFFPVLHFDESESSRPACKLINDDPGGIYCAIRFKQALEFFFTGIEGQVPNIDFNTHSLTP